MDLEAGFSALVPLDGGWSGETFLARAGTEQVVVRIYGEQATRGAVGADVDAALLRLVRGLLPVAEVLELRSADADAGLPGLLVTALVPGVRADELLPRLDERRLAVLGGAVGDLVAALGGMPMLDTGPFVDASLRVGSFGAAGEHGAGLEEYVESRAGELAHLSADELTGLQQVARQAQTLLDTVGRRCLVHADLNPKNLLVDPDELVVTAVVDWGFAHAGHPYTDLGNVLRFDRAPAYAEAVLDRYVAARGVQVDDALALARAGLVSLVDLACRRHRNPVAARADRLLRQIARTRDAGASEPA